MLLEISAFFENILGYSFGTCSETSVGSSSTIPFPIFLGKYLWGFFNFFGFPFRIYFWKQILSEKLWKFICNFYENLVQNGLQLFHWRVLQQSFRSFSGIVFEKPIGNDFKIPRTILLGFLSEIPLTYSLWGPPEISLLMHAEISIECK